MTRPLPGRILWLACLLLAAPWAAAAEQVWLDLDRPEAQGALAGPVALAEVEGWAAAGSARAYDVVLVLDVSGSTLLPSGGDVDGDGRIGRKLRSADDPLRSFNPHRLCSDPGDSIRAAEIAAARRFLAGLDPERTRVALVIFAETAEERVPLAGSRQDLEVALDRLADEAGFGWGATDLSAALRQGRATLEAGEAALAAPRQRWIVLLSDGTPNRPGNPRRAASEALAEVQQSVAARTRIHAFALGEEVMEGSEVYREVAERSGGRFAWVQRPADVVPRLARLDLSQVSEIRVENASTGETGRAIRVSPDGRFDGLVPLAPGENRIRVTARGSQGAESAAERVVHFEEREPRTPEEVRAARAVLERLRVRTDLLELGLDIERRRGQSLELEIRPVEMRGERPDVAAPPPESRGDGARAPRP